MQIEKYLKKHPDDIMQQMELEALLVLQGVIWNENAYIEKRLEVFETLTLEKRERFYKKTLLKLKNEPQNKLYELDLKALALALNISKESFSNEAAENSPDIK